MGSLIPFSHWWFDHNVLDKPQAAGFIETIAINYELTISITKLIKYTKTKSKQPHYSLNFSISPFLFLHFEQFIQGYKLVEWAGQTVVGFVTNCDHLAFLMIKFVPLHYVAQCCPVGIMKHKSGTIVLANMWRVNIE